MLLHGLWRSRRSMWAAARAARRRGFEVINWGYPSFRRPIHAHAAALERVAYARLRGRAGRVHFLTHSLGGIVLRAYLAAHDLPALGRVVMLGPPNGGNEIAERLRGWWTFRRVMGPAGVELGTGPESVPRALPPVTFELGVVAGILGRPAFFGAWIASPNDGLVSVDATRVAGMRDHVVVPGGHAFLPVNRRALHQAFTFIRTGAFDHAGRG